MRWAAAELREQYATRFRDMGGPFLGYQRRKILHILAPGEVGGLESVVRSLASAQQAQGHLVAVAAVVDRESPEHPWVTAARAEGIPVYPCPIPPRAYHKERAAIARICRTLEPEIVHTQGYRPDVLAGGVARRLGHATVTTVHGFTGGGIRNRFYEWLQLRAFRRFDAVVAVARALGERLAAAGVPRERLHVIPNAYAAAGPPLGRDAARAMLGVPPEGYRLGWAGRLGREKGADVLVDALGLLRDLPISLSVVGAGRESAALGARAETRDVSDRIRWHGTVPDAARLLPAFDCFVLSSRTEGTPMVLFEAMAAEVPVVAAAVGGVPDIVSAEEALLVPPEDPAALAGAIRAVHADPAGAASRARAARRRLDSDYGVAGWVARYDGTYAAVTRASRGAPL
jgi:glycosyltransferase involved in cell wall biosynthesis